MGDLQIDSFMVDTAANANQDGEAKGDSEVCAVRKVHRQAV